MPRRNKSHHQRRARARLARLDARAAADPGPLPLWLELDMAARSLVRRGLASPVILGPIGLRRQRAQE